MSTPLLKAKYWQDFIIEKARFPYPGKLRAQFDAAKLSDFCDCGCNSFRVTIPEEAKVKPLAHAVNGEGPYSKLTFA